MKELTKIERNSFYSNTGFESNKGNNLAKLPIILCAAVGVFLGSIAFSASHDNKSLNGNIIQSKLSITEAFIEQFENSDVSENIKDLLFIALGMDRYNPITIINANYPYFKMFYENDYRKYVAQKLKEEQELYAKKQMEQQIEKHKDALQKSEAQKLTTSEVILKEVSSSITFEGDVEQEDQKNNPVVSSGKNKLINETKYSINIDKLLKEPLKLSKNNSGPQILIYHTHTTEGYLKSIDELTKSVPSRTSNKNFNVVGVGESLINNLKKYNIKVIHNTTVHDSDFNISYVKSLKTLTSYVKNYPSLQMTIDLHRDAIGSGKLREVKKVNGENVAQIMFVIGTDAKLSNPNWRENLKLALRIQSRINELYPGLAKPIYISNNRYNQHLINGSVIIEIGGDGNVSDECKRSTYYLAQAINDVLNKNK